MGKAVVYLVDFEAAFQLQVCAPEGMSREELSGLIATHLSELVERQSPVFSFDMGSEPDDEVGEGDVGRTAVIVNDDGDGFVYGEDTAWLVSDDSSPEPAPRRTVPIPAGRITTSVRRPVSIDEDEEGS